MATITVRNLPDAVHRALRLRAAENGRSVEAEVRALLAEAAGARAGVAEQPAAPFEAEPLPGPSGVRGIWRGVTSPNGSVVDDLIASRRLEALVEGGEITREEHIDLSDKLEKGEIDLAWVERFFEQRIRK